MIKLTFVFLLFVSLVFTACDSGRIHEENVEMEDRIWIADSSVNLEFQIKDPKQHYDLLYNLRNSISYPFQNIYINYTLEDTLGNTLAADLINKDLFHPKTGKPYGDGLGDVFDHQFMLLEDYQFDHAGTYNIKLQQFMRRDSLPEIISVGIRVQKAKKEEDN